MAEKEPLVGATEIRAVLAKAKAPLTCKDIMALCDTIENTTQVASMMSEEVRTGRVERHGERGNYSYTITAAGKDVAANPRMLRSRSNRRMRGRSTPPKPEPGKHSTEPVPIIEGLDASGWLPVETVAASLASETPNPAPPRMPERDMPQDDGRARLAASVITYWPTALADMPDPLARAIDESLSVLRPAT